MKKHTIVRIIIQSLVMILFGLFLILYLHHELFGSIIGGSGIIVLILGLFIPPAKKGLIRIQEKVIKWVGIILTWLLLVPFYFLCFIPGRIILLLSGKDPLNRKFPDTGKSCWSPYSGSFDSEQCKRQY
ncbi:MAG: hypothetical protein JXJ04_11340 [Spirochaetales bacterium]|nr:hypothetical protein [Spirochaetales bacterium]